MKWYYLQTLKTISTKVLISKAQQRAGSQCCWGYCASTLPDCFVASQAGNMYGWFLPL
jgi:hypothetical protein